MEAANIRKTILRMLNKANTSHCGSALSCVEILQAVYDRIDIEKIQSESNDRDRVILSKGHAGSALYAVMNVKGLMSDEDIDSYYKEGSFFSGQANPNIKPVEDSTGALGHGIAVGVGVAYGMKLKGYLDSHVYVIVGDGELNEGSNWEAMLLAGNQNLDNMTVIVDDNGLAGIGKTCDLGDLRLKFEAFKFSVQKVDGHDYSEISDALSKKNGKQPNAIICKTVKGKGVDFMENDNVWHYRPVGDEYYDRALKNMR